MQVERNACFGQGAVRARGVRTAVESASFRNWMFAIFVAGAAGGIGVVIAVLARQIGTLNNVLQEVASGVAVAALPISILRWLVKVSFSCVHDDVSTPATCLNSILKSLCLL